jgi:putative inorganic carbon (hco3(-)) transporter
VGHILVILVLAAVALTSMAFPWIGVICGYLLSVLQPQSIWYWDFWGIRPELWVLLPTGVGFVVGIIRGTVKLDGLWNRRNLYIAILWLCSAISYYFGPYTHVGGPYRFEDAGYRFSELNKIFLLYFVACACIDNERKLKALFYVMVVSGVYLIYWANAQYLTGHFYGRLEGPSSPAGGGVYTDQNSFAALFVIAQPFIWFLGGSFRRAWCRWACWLIVPFCWHAVFLTGSRGGLLGLGATIVLTALRSRRKILALTLIPAFIFVFAWQGGHVMKGRADTIVDYQQDASAEDRIESWHAALGMIRDHPLTGVGVASYGPAFPHYSDKQPREAHDTFLQIAAESGVLAGAMYLLVVFGSLASLWKNGSRIRPERRGNVDVFYLAASEATLIGWLGLAVCSLFLSLQQFEVFYYLAVMTNVVVGLESKDVVPESAPPAGGLRFARARKMRGRVWRAGEAKQ